MVSKITFVVFLGIMNLTIAIPNQNVIVESYNSKRHEQFVRGLILENDLHNNSDFYHDRHQLCTINDSLVHDDLHTDEYINFVQENDFFEGLAMRFRRFIRGKKYRQEIHVATQDNKPVGFIRWRFTSDSFFEPHKFGWIEQFAVVAECRRRGFGQLLLKKLLERASAEHVCQVYSVTNAQQRSVQALYAKMGFTKSYESSDIYSKITSQFDYDKYTEERNRPVVSDYTTA